MISEGAEASSTVRTVDVNGSLQLPASCDNAYKTGMHFCRAAVIDEILP